MTLRKPLAKFSLIALAALCCFSISDKMAAGTKPETAPIITYAASGTFASTPTSGDDTLKLAGEPLKEFRWAGFLSGTKTLEKSGTKAAVKKVVKK